MKRFLSIIKFVGIGFFILVFILAIFPVVGRGGALKKANADSLNAYPSVCLGGWQNPGNAAGQPNVSPGGNSFTVDNSAVLDGAQAQIFCGSFSASDQSQTPSSVTLNFSWNVIFPNQSMTGADISTATTTATDTSSDNASWSSVIDATSTDTSSTLDQDDASSTAAPASSSDPADQSSTSLLQNIFGGPLGFIVERSFADTASTTASSTTASSSVDTADDFIDVSYSLDGTTWTDLGQVSESDWQNYSVNIPINSWNDINNLQVQLSPLMTPDAPTIYLDNMWLQVNYNQSVLGDLQSGASAAVNAVTGLSNAVGDAVDSATNAIADLLSPEATSTPEDATSTTPIPTVPTVTAPAPPAHQYTFQLGGAMPADVHDLSWVPQTAVTAYDAGLATQGTTMPSVTLPDVNTIQVTGSCSEDYYTILLFSNQTDYTNNPSGALVNNANPCVGGSFSWTISDNQLPPQLPPGTYYLMVANQGKRGPWQPYPEFYSVIISNVSQ